MHKVVVEVLEEEEEAPRTHLKTEIPFLNPPQQEVVAEEEQGHIKRGRKSHKLNVIPVMDLDILPGNVGVVMA